MDTGYIGKRLIGTVLLLLATVFVTLAVLHLAPGDPAISMLGEYATSEQIQQFREDLGLNLPLPLQYLRYLGKAVHGDLGESIRYRRPALLVVLERVPATLQLTLVGFTIAVGAGIPLGIAGAVNPKSFLDRCVVLFSTLAQSIPGFWFGALLIVLFAVRLGLLPTSGSGTLAHLVLPSVTLAIGYIGLATRMTRQSMREVLASDYVRTARAKGLRESTVIARHALRNGLTPVVTVLGLQIGQLIGGAVVTEGVFAWPGVGSAAITAIYQRDYPVVQAVVLLTAVAIVAANLSVDFMYRFLDPRVRVS